MTHRDGRGRVLGVGDPPRRARGRELDRLEPSTLHGGVGDLDAEILGGRIVLSRPPPPLPVGGGGAVGAVARHLDAGLEGFHVPIQTRDGDDQRVRRGGGALVGTRFDGLLGHVDHLDLLVEDVLGDALRGIAAVGWSGGHRLGGGDGGVLLLSATAATALPGQGILLLGLSAEGGKGGG